MGYNKAHFKISIKVLDRENVGLSLKLEINVMFMILIWLEFGLVLWICYVIVRASARSNYSE